MSNNEVEIDTQKALSALERRKEAYKRYKNKLLLKQYQNETIEEIMAIKEADRIRRFNESYQKHLEQMRQQRRDRGLKPKGRPFKNIESENKQLNLMKEIEYIRNCDNIEMIRTPSLESLNSGSDTKCLILDSLDI